MGLVTLSDGRQAREASIVTANEPWAEAILDDGTVVRVRLVIGKILVVEGETDAYGSPVVAVESFTVASVSRSQAEPG